MQHTLSCALVTATAALLSPLSAQQVVLGQDDYVAPPQKIVSILESDAMHNRVSLSNLGPDGKHFLVPRSMGMPTLASFARPYLNLGEVPIDDEAMRNRRLSTGNTIGYDLIHQETGKRTSIESPANVTVSSAVFAPNGKKLAFLVHEDRGSFVHVATLPDGKSRRISKRRVLATHVTSLRWTQNSSHVVAVLVPNGAKAPRRGRVASQPSVWNTHPGNTPSRTYRFLLKTPHDMAMLEFLSTGQLSMVSAQDGKITAVGKPAMIQSVDVSPTGSYFRVRTMQKPFSYFVPASQFGNKEEIWDRSGKVLHQISERKLRVGARTRRSAGATDTKRSLTWRPGGGLVFLQREPAPKPKPKPKAGKKGAAKGGKSDKKNPAAGAKTPRPKPAKAKPKTAAKSKTATPKPRKDRVMYWPAPFKKDGARVLFESKDAIQTANFGADGRSLFVTQTLSGKRTISLVNLRTKKVVRKLHQAKATPQATTRFPRRRGGGRGVGLLTRRSPRGGLVVRTSRDRKSVFLVGSDQAKPKESARPYLDRITLANGKSERVWQARGDRLESLQAILDPDASTLMISRQSRTEPANSFRVEVKTGKEQQMTKNEDPAPTVTAAIRHRIQVTRVDGFKFWVTATVPQHYGKRLPALFWFYPREFTDQKSYDARQRTPDPNRFPTLRTTSKDMLTLFGYVVVVPDCPIVGPAGRMNDRFVGDLRNSLWATIDALDKRDLIDRDRLAIGGHSYGAFGTANALVHTPFFKAGIAGDGNYNRTLTPMSFQSERRNIWDARETYFRMSPLLWAEQLNGALLMYHGMDDNNTGTFPLHSPRMFQALDGLGKTAALYQYPYEGHGPRARETIFDLWSRWIAWLDLHVKDPGAAKKAAKAKAKAKPVATPTAKTN